ncbi:unnamed protein product [Meloidogyne enterolobii]|uniref:Uncharacterized protein n=1 Tax=Meloidogyne enterolobii TaxID=390850 RepID=A0ACB0ZWI8_MELEN
MTSCFLCRFRSSCQRHETVKTHSVLSSYFKIKCKYSSNKLFVIPG